MIGVDFDGAAGLRDLELDVLEPIARRAPHRVNHDLVAGRAGDPDAAREGLQPHGPVGGQRHRAIDGLRLARPAVVALCCATTMTR